MISTSDSGPLGSSGSTWKAFTLSAHSPANAAKMAIFLTKEAGAGQVVYFDGVRLKIPGLVGKYDFTGKKTDDESGLTYFGARFYDSEVGRFVTVDPKKDGGNWFEYCGENPLRFIDLKGTDPETTTTETETSPDDKTITKTTKDPDKPEKGKVVEEIKEHQNHFFGLSWWTKTSDIITGYNSKGQEEYSIDYTDPTVVEMTFWTRNLTKDQKNALNTDKSLSFWAQGVSWGLLSFACPPAAGICFAAGTLMGLGSCYSSVFEIGDNITVTVEIGLCYTTRTTTVTNKSGQLRTDIGGKEINVIGWN